MSRKTRRHRTVHEAPPESEPEPVEVATEVHTMAPSHASLETRELLEQIRQQEKLQQEQERSEAKLLARRARELEKRTKERERLRREITELERHAERLAPELGFDPKRPITVIPPLTDPAVSQVELNAVLEGRSYIRIVYNSATSAYLYEIIEPTLSSVETQVLEFLRETLVRTLEGRHGNDPTEWERSLIDGVERAILDHSILIDAVGKQRLLYYLVRDFLGYGPIDVLMRDPMIEDISCDGPGIPVYLFHRQYESLRTNVVFSADLQLDAFVVRLAQRSGKHISIADPLLDATLPDGSRLQASLSKEVTTRGSSFTIRKFRSDPLSPTDLVRLGTMSPELAAYFWLAMQEGRSLILAGGTASGKTTSLNAMCMFIPPAKKIVSIEDTREINLQHENWIAGLTRAGFGGEYVGGKQAGSIDMYKLLEAALRQRPEYLVVGEVRGPEAVTLFQAMATGHATYSTLHADSVASAVYRLENPPINVPRMLLQTLDIVAVQLQVRIKNRLARRLNEVTEIAGIDQGTLDILTNKVFEWDATTDRYKFSGKSQIFEEIREKNGLTREQILTEWRNRVEILEWMVEKGVRSVQDISDVVAEYYRQPEQLLARIREAPKDRRSTA